MLALDSGDKIQGDTTTASKVDYTIHGLDNNAVKQMADGQLPNSIGDLYTADSADIVTAIILVNTNTSVEAVNLYLTPSGGTARRLIAKDTSLGVGYSLHFDGARVAILDPVGGVVSITTYGDHASYHENTGADEISVAGLSGLLADDQHVLDAEVVAAVEAAGLTFAENKGIILDAALSADGKWSGIVETGTAGAVLAFGDLVYFAVADSKWELTDASAAATAFGKIGICVLAAAENAATVILLYGKVRADAVFPALTIGAPVHMSETAGDIVVAAPVTSGAIVRIIGYGNTADELFFCPDNTYLELA